MTKLFIGVMSGTSLDGIDAVLSSIQGENLNTLQHHSIGFSPEIRENIQTLCTTGENEIERCGELDIIFAKLTAQTINELLEKAKLSAKDISAIGSHGQTIRHLPDSEHPFSLQVGNPSVIAHLTGITTVADFRMADIAAGGQGAPLVPAFHRTAFASSKNTRIIVNIGGISNITLLSPEPNSLTTGYDIGPGNTLIDQWIQKNLNLPFDKNGDWARTGKVIPELMANFQQDTFIKKSGPKSTGREYFNLHWLQEILTKTGNNQTPDYASKDIQRTLTEFTATLIAQNIKRETNEVPCEIYLCGGGVNNGLLKSRLEALVSNYSIETTAKLGIDPQHVEATAFAWLASQTLAGLAGNITEVTGASVQKILGGIYLA